MRVGSTRFTEEELLPLSALQHLAFCPRQCALIHIEQIWEDNPRTLEGQHLHFQVHEEAPRRERRGDLLIVRGLPLRSFQLGVSGIADVVEFHKVAAGSRKETSTAPGISLKGLPGLWRPFPVEYKRGKPKPDSCDEVQLCAQAICLEEMLGVAVPEGALFYGAQQRRHSVVFHKGLREKAEQVAQALHELMAQRETPRAVWEPKCRNCSLIRFCLPETVGSGRSAEKYLLKALTQIEERAGEDR